MKIILIGAGELGQLLAERLCAAEHDVVLVDAARAESDRIREKLDVMSLVGDATDVHVMKQAGVTTADVVLAVSGDQASNMLACRLARHFGTRTTICRVYNLDAFSEADGILPEFYGIDHVFSAAEECAKRVAEVLVHPAVLEQTDFSNPNATLVTLRVDEDSPLNGTKLQDIPDQEIRDNVRLAALIHRRRLRFPTGKTIIEADDQIFVAGDREHVAQFIAYVEGKKPRPRPRIVLGGATLQGLHIAQAAMRLGLPVVVIDPDRQLGQELLAQLPGISRVLCGPTTDEDTLREAGIAECDVYVNAEEDDENGILSCIVAKRLGAAKAVSVAHKPGYMEIVPEMAVIDCGFNSTVIAVNTVLQLINEGVHRVNSRLQRFKAYLAEFHIQPSSRLVGKLVRDARLPPNVVLAMIFRGDTVMAPAGSVALQAGDTIAAIVTPSSEELLKPYFQS